jgi:hypothetical protein
LEDINGQTIGKTTTKSTSAQGGQAQKEKTGTGHLIANASKHPLPAPRIRRLASARMPFDQRVAKRRRYHANPGGPPLLLGCLGVKSAFGRIFNTRREYRQLRDGMTARQSMIKADLNLVAKIIREAIAYAKELGFKPDPDYRDAMPVLGDADPDACDVPIPLGKDGKPFFIAGPYDNVDRIIAKLTRKLGTDGFHFLVPISGDEQVFLEEEV